MTEQELNKFKVDLEKYSDQLKEIYIKKIEILDDLFITYDASLGYLDYEMFSMLMNEFIKKKFLEK